MIQLECRSRIKKIWIRLLVFLGIRLRLHSKTSVILRLRLRNHSCYNIFSMPEPWSNWLLEVHHFLNKHHLLDFAARTHRSSVCKEDIWKKLCDDRPAYYVIWMHVYGARFVIDWCRDSRKCNFLPETFCSYLSFFGEPKCTSRNISLTALVKRQRKDFR